MRVRLFVFFLVFMLHGYSQSVLVGYSHGVSNIARVSYEHRLNNVVFAQGGVGCTITDSVKITYDVNANEQRNYYNVYSPSINVAIGAKSNTKPLYCFGALNSNISTLNIKNYLSMGLGYKINNGFIRLSTLYTFTQVGYGAEIGFNF